MYLLLFPLDSEKMEVDTTAASADESATGGRQPMITPVPVFTAPPDVRIEQRARAEAAERRRAALSTSRSTKEESPQPGTSGSQRLDWELKKPHQPRSAVKDRLGNKPEGSAKRALTSPSCNA